MKVRDNVAPCSMMPLLMERLLGSLRASQASAFHTLDLMSSMASQPDFFVDERSFCYGQLSAYAPARASSKNEVLSVPFALARYIALSASRIRVFTSSRSPALWVSSMRTPMLADTAIG